MRSAKNWKDFELIDVSGGERLERWGNITLIRPDPQVIWNTEKSGAWKNASARYIRSKTGGGSWDDPSITERRWQINYGNLSFWVQPTGFKHTGLFPEQAVNWDWMESAIQGAGRPVNAMSLFAYTGGATLALAKAGASVCHVDASKGMVGWARENAKLSGLEDKPIRWIVDDCIKFVRREIRRGVRYEAIVMDPPSYGRGPGGEVWKLEDSIFELTQLCAELLSDNPLFFMINSYTTGLSPSVMGYILSAVIEKKRGGLTQASEIGIIVRESGLALPCGSTAIWSANP